MRDSIVFHPKESAYEFNEEKVREKINKITEEDG